jgi:peptide/nickel transport system ATP-binding protein
MALEVEDLRIQFGRREVVRGVSYSVGDGERLGLIGESGSGKTLSVLAVLGLLPPNAEVSGSIRWNGAELVGRPDRELARLRGREIGIVFQDPTAALNPIRTIGAQLGESLAIHYDLGRDERRLRIHQAAEQVGLPDPDEFLRRYPHELSGGQRQRVAIAMAVITGPRLIIADEPTTALDVTVQAGILDLFNERVSGLGSSLIFVTHDIALLASVTERALVLADGEVVEAGLLSQLLQAPTQPITAGLIAAARATSWNGAPA